jgi:hypothetical protein
MTKRSLDVVGFDVFTLFVLRIAVPLGSSSLRSKVGQWRYSKYAPAKRRTSGMMKRGSLELLGGNE